MKFSMRNKLVGFLFAFTTFAGAAAVSGQTSAPADSASSSPSASAVAPDMSAVTAAFTELEARVAELENARRREQDDSAPPTFRTVQLAEPPAIAPGGAPEEVRDPAIRTVDEQTRPFADTDETGNLIQGWIGRSQDPAITTVQEQTGATGTARHWFDRLSIRGYAQFRLNEVPWYDHEGAPPQHLGDASVAPDQSFLLRRARMVLSGDVSDHMYVYIQPDFAASVPGSADANHFAQLRDFYCDIYFDSNKVHRLRVGQSKIPFGWENLQSSSNRIPLDRNDGLNSAGKNERDLGVLYYYTPEFAQDLFKYVLEEGLKGSGNYGLFGFGVYNGQGGSIREQNDDLHLVARLTVPMQLANEQVVELGVQCYTGTYNVLTSAIQPLGQGLARAPSVLPGGYLDERVGGTLVYYPQPLGFQAEWNVGHGPVLNEAQTEVVDGSLNGGYGMLMVRRETDCWGTFFPFLRYAHYDGGFKSERNAPQMLIDEWELGLEWQINKQMELTAEYTFTDRTNTTALSSGESYRQFNGDIIRLQFQANY